MTKIKYYDRINEKVITINVKNEIADEIRKSKNKEKKANRKWKSFQSYEYLIEQNEKQEDGLGVVDLPLTEDDCFFDEIDEQVELTKIELLKQQILLLPDINRTILNMKFKNYFSNVKIAKMLNFTEGYVRKILKQSYKKLHNALKK